MMTLDTAKSCFAQSRSTVTTAVHCFNVVNTAAYLTGALSEETYTVVFLSGMLGSMAYNLLDASVSYAAKGAYSITDRDAEKTAKQNIEALNASIAFQANPCWETAFKVAGLPSNEKLTDHWEVASLAGKALSGFANMKQFAFLYNAFGRWFVIPQLFEKIVEMTIREKGKEEEVNRDAETMDRWLAVMKAMPKEETDHPIQKELEEKFAPTLNRMIALNPQIGIQYAMAFQQLMAEKSLPKNEAAL